MLFQNNTLRQSIEAAQARHADCMQETVLARCTGRTTMDFRWVILLTLWTLLIGPVLDFTQSAPTEAPQRAKTANAKSKSAR
jgi:hypothetical protein